ncbi:S8 family serine peptidase [Paenalkalicoccus suaedae]|uniref:S8 family serine peptidase n=1 Tax=Paenalkalicoccus suaedae TaxID=2592382 RepID=A0A859FD61_9BACI|nr:S8 family serine peptidase [Paenalkalicoccus suaedae]QKS70514.1 S8 family serine peptidase [Paenalkalicoccus suaedae]
MKKLFALLLISTFVIGLFPVSSFAAINLPQERVIVTFKQSVDRAAITSIGGQLTRQYRNIPAVAMTVPSASIQRLKNNPNVLSVEKDLPVRVSSQTEDYGNVKVQAPKARQAGFTGKGVKVAVIDSGIAPHSDLKIAGGASFVSYTNSFADDHGHGTHVAGIIAAQNNTIGTLGVAPDVSLYGVKVLDQQGSGFQSGLIAGIDWAITNKMDIVNLSLGSSTATSALKTAVDKAQSQGITLVAAAGNKGNPNGTGDTVDFPARYDSVIAVAATDIRDARGSFSATGNTVEVAAPGVSITSTVLNNGYGRKSGTSMAAPHVAGVLALLKQANPQASPSQLRAELQKSSVDLGVTGRDAHYGFGLVQAPTVRAQAPTIMSPAPEPPAVTETFTSVSTDKATYRVPNRVRMTTKVVTVNEEPIASAMVQVKVTDPAGKVRSYRGRTGKNGSISFTMSTTRQFPRGTYTVQSDSSLKDHASSSATTTFVFR